MRPVRPAKTVRDARVVERPCDESRLPDKDGYVPFLDALTAETSAFDGRIGLVHGDTHDFKIDKPLRDATHLLPNLTRVQT
ncbi:MAG: hypothetical protein KDG89_11130 [Geminicoccaceae bacterium]|nr:hypothetical protein [Geminicoccaceae bacterium]